MELYQKLEEVKLLPLYTATDLAYLKDVEEILLENDVPLIEVTFRSDLALDAIEGFAKSGKLIVGAGTVRSLDQAKAAIEKGAQFIVCPTVIDEVITYCVEHQIPVFPGTATPSDIQRVVEHGLSIVKFFPANIYGGLPAIQALRGPFFDVKFLPTGGISKDNFLEYIEDEAIVAVGGSFILSESMIAQKGKEQASQYLRSLVQQIR